MNYEQVAGRLGIGQWCRGDCGLSAYRHRTGTVFLSVVHWSPRRLTRRGLRRFLLLVARRDRYESPDYLNTPSLTWFHLHDDEMYANMLAGMLGIRFPAEFSRTERLRCLASAKANGVPLSARRPAIFAWANRGRA